MKVLLVWRDVKKGKRSFIGAFKNKEEAYASVWDWWQSHSFEPKYIRAHEEEFNLNGITRTRTILDYGSHSQFYQLWNVEDDFEPNYVALHCKTRVARCKKEYQFVDMVYDELIPNCKVEDDALVICGMRCKRDKWYGEEHYKVILNNMKHVIKNNADRIKDREKKTTLIYSPEETFGVGFTIKGETVVVPSGL